MYLGEVGPRFGAKPGSGLRVFQMKVNNISKPTLNIHSNARIILVFEVIMNSENKSTSRILFPPPNLQHQLAAVLSKCFTCKIYYLSTPPTRTSALYSAPPDGRPDRTYCTSHFLTVSILAPTADAASEVIAFAIEVLIYSTAYDTTFFVSKADSTGYLHLVRLPRGTPSPIREISAVFLEHLLEQHRRENIRSVVSLFARSQNQYLFPGSIENDGKHLQDDRGLIRWWCRVLDPLVKNAPIVGDLDRLHWECVKGYLIVPGLETYETRSYMPSESRTAGSPWTVGHPLRQITRYPEDIPPRCLIPRFPDDPKARYLEELDREISKGQQGENGQWKSVKTIDQFWEMMAFRQECSAGRLVGFIWIVFEPVSQHEPAESIMGDSQNTAMTVESQPWDTDVSFLQGSIPATSFAASSQIQPFVSPAKSDATTQYSPRKRSPSVASSRRGKEKLSGPIVPRQPRTKTESRNHVTSRPESTAYYVWRPSGRGQVIVEESDYKRINELLLNLDFANLNLAMSSSKRWIEEVRSSAWGNEGESWGQTVTGTREIAEKEVKATAGGINTLNVGPVRKKRKEAPAEEPPAEKPPQVNVLSGNMVRKKAKV